MKKDKADTDAATAARAMSRILRSAGLTMANTKDKYRWTEGYHVSRVGVSQTVAVNYHIPAHANWTDSQRDRQRAAMDAARALLKMKGYDLDDRGWFECKWEAS